MSSPPETSRRLYIRILLVAGMLVSAVALYFVLRPGFLGDLGAPPALARSTLRVQIVDTNGRPIQHAAASLLGASNDAPAKAEWASRSAILTISSPGGGLPSARALRITARGFRSREVRSITADKVAVLQPGLRMRVLLHDVPAEGIPEHIRILLRVRPAHVDPSDAGASEVIHLMHNLGAPGSGPRNVKRDGFGYAVSLAQARAGVILPEPGPYQVHWGLMDVRAQTWYSLSERCGRVFQVRDTSEIQDFTLPLSFDHLQETLDRLAAKVRQAGK